jgi:hypothetical protein
VSAEILISDAGVSYDSKIIEVFNDPELVNEIIAESGDKILQISDDEIWIKVIVELKDDSGIEVVGTKEEKRELMGQIDGWFEPQVEDFLLNLNDGDFKVGRKSSRGFVASVNEEGANNLIENSKLSKIRMDAVGSVTTKGDGGKNILFYASIILAIIILYLIYTKYLRKK